MSETEAKLPTTKRILVTSLLVDVFDMIINTVVAVLTGSVIMIVEAIEGFAGLCAAGMLLFSNKRSGKKPTKLHPFGYSKELYYWSTIIAFVIVAIAGVIAIRLGYSRFVSPEAIHRSWLAYIALTVALGTNIYSLWLSIGKLLEDQPFHKMMNIFMNSPIIAPKITAVLDTMGSVVALCGLLAFGLSGITGNNQFDGAGAVAMGFALLFAAVGLLLSVRSLVVGQGAPRELERKLRDAARDIPEVKHILGMRTMMVGSDRLLVNVDVHLKDGLSTDQVEYAVAKIKETMEKTDENNNLRIHVEPDALDDHQRSAKF
ncbi:MAG TPA: cation diffusion facilitator family transporter [Patescibacteria group bacterium]|nr:cation diffusion facilitator family transporter [Patescibacteria group bacterium]